MTELITRIAGFTEGSATGVGDRTIAFWTCRYNYFLSNNGLVFPNINKYISSLLPKTWTNSVQFIEIAIFSSRTFQIRDESEVRAVDILEAVVKASFRLVRLSKPDKHNCKFWKRHLPTSVLISWRSVANSSSSLYVQYKHCILYLVFLAPFERSCHGNLRTMKRHRGVLISRQNLST